LQVDTIKRLQGEWRDRDCPLPLDIFDIKALIGKVNTLNTNKIHLFIFFLSFFIFFFGLLGQSGIDRGMASTTHPPKTNAIGRRVLCCAGWVKTFRCFSIGPRFKLRVPHN
jgi:hypothetical protein